MKRLVAFLPPLLPITTLVVALLCLPVAFAHPAPTPVSEVTAPAAVDLGMSEAPAPMDHGSAAAAPSEAAAIPDPAAAPGAFAREMTAAVTSGRYRVAVIGALVLMVAGARSHRLLLVRAVPWLRTDRGGAAFALGVGIASSITVHLAAGEPFAAGVLAGAVDGLFNGATAIGAFTGAKRLVRPRDKLSVRAT